MTPTTKRTRFQFKDRIVVDSPAFEKYINAISTMAPKTQRTYRARLYSFVEYTKNIHNCSIDKGIKDIKTGKLSIYDVLNGYVAYLHNGGYNGSKASANYISDCVKTAKQLLEYHDCDVVDSKFRVKVKLPKRVRKEKEAIDKEDIRKILLAADTPEAKTYLMLLAATGMRATEALSIRYHDLDLEGNPPRVNISGEFTKTKTDRYVYLTSELLEQIKSFIGFKHRVRRIGWYDENGKYCDELRAPEKRDEDLLFGFYMREESKIQGVTPEALYDTYMRKVNSIIDRVAGKREDHSGFRTVTRHTFRRFVKSTISDLGYADYSEWFIGHSGSTYYRKKDTEKAEIFHKIEPYLTFLDVTGLEAEGADQQTRLDQMQFELQKEREERAKLYELLYKQGIIKKE